MKISINPPRTRPLSGFEHAFVDDRELELKQIEVDPPLSMQREHCYCCLVSDLKNLPRQ